MERQDQVARLRQTLADSKALIQQLLQNNEVLEQQIGELLPCGFLDLPREMRDRIYDLLLVPGKVFIRPRPTEDPRLDDYEDYFKPQLQLLATNRQIRAEAAETLFTKNQIVLNNRNDAYGPLLKDEGTTHIPGSLSSFFHQHLTSVSIALDLHSYWPLSADDNVMSFGNDLRSDPSWDWEALSQEQREEYAHDVMHEKSGHWQSIVGAILQHSRTLRFLQIDVTNCYCVLGTCRLIGQVFSSLAYFHSRIQHYGPRLEVVEVLGTKTLDDRITILSAFLNSPNYPQHAASDRKPKLRFKAFKMPKGSTCISLHTSDLEDDLDDEEFDIHEMMQKGDLNKVMVRLGQRKWLGADTYLEQ